MAKKITQATFDDVVKENIDEFGMSPEEALTDAISQFEKQGVDLSGVVKTLVQGDENRLGEFQSLVKALDANDTEKVKSLLSAITTKFDDKDMRVYAGKHNALPLLINTCKYLADVGDEAGVVATFYALALLLDGQPDLLSPPPGQLTEDVFAEGIPVNAATKTLCRIVETHKSSAAVTTASLTAIGKACTKHEINRQAFVDHGAVELVLHTLQVHTATSAAATAAAADCLRTLLLDDDVRVPFGKAHTQARGILHEGNGLELLVKSMTTLATDDAAVAPLAVAVARLAVRSELCQQIVDIGGVSAALTAMQAHERSAQVQQACCALIRAVAGNDSVKAHVVTIGAAEAIVNAMQTHLKAASVIEQGCGAVAALCLRCETNSRTVASLGAPSVVVRGMQSHRGNLRVQRQACQALRNLVSRTPELRDAVLMEGAEYAIREAMSTHPGCNDVAKGALRDLGCKVELRELWTGTSGLGPEITEDTMFDDRE